MKERFIHKSEASAKDITHVRSKQAERTLGSMYANMYNDELRMTITKVCVDDAMMFYKRKEDSDGVEWRGEMSHSDPKRVVAALCPNSGLAEGCSECLRARWAKLEEFIRGFRSDDIIRGYIPSVMCKNSNKNQENHKKIWNSY